MSNEYDDQYWSSQFVITQDDIKRIEEWMARESAPQDIQTIALRIVRGRIEHGQDLSPAILVELTGKPSIRLWDPAVEWRAGDVVLIARQSYKGRRDTPQYQAYIGEITTVNKQVACILIDNESVKYSLAIPDSKEALHWYETVREVVESKFQSGNLDQQAEGTLIKHGERILSHLNEILQSDRRFTGLEGKWYITQKIPQLEGASLRKAHQLVRQANSASVDELLPDFKDSMPINETLLRMAIHSALQHSPERFENIGTLTRPQWKARIPEPGKAEATHYAYDPQTYEILCRPGQRLNQKISLRLQELNLYSDIVTFAE